MNGIGRPLIIMGLILVAAGVIISFSPRIPWLGRLPGDIYIRKAHYSFSFPLTTCILLSAILSFIFWLLRR
ncbi:MAG: DUF2905 domain-containing protein [Desulfuromonadales bacterium]|nr:DUF2905 domain-containing protein [Desulfuromonadales bacterium]